MHTVAGKDTKTKDKIFAYFGDDLNKMIDYEQLKKGALELEAP
jgi:hypothetical protein